MISTEDYKKIQNGHHNKMAVIVQMATYYWIFMISKLLRIMNFSPILQIYCKRFQNSWHLEMSAFMKVQIGCKC